MKPVINSALRIPNCMRNAEDSVPYDISVKICVFTDSCKGCPYKMHRKNIYLVRMKPVINSELRITNSELFCGSSGTPTPANYAKNIFT